MPADLSERLGLEPWDGIDERVWSKADDIVADRVADRDRQVVEAVARWLEGEAADNPRVISPWLVDALFLAARHIRRELLASPDAEEER